MTRKKNERKGNVKRKEQCIKRQDGGGVGKGTRKK
jgi:hypothetical protein